MDPKVMMEMLGNNPQMANSFGVGASEMKQMQEMMQQMKTDPDMKKQMEGYWKMLDNMHKEDPKEYQNFIDN